MIEEIKDKKQNVVDIAKALQQDFATSVNRIYISSLDREVGFKEVTVTQQKTLSRILIEHEKRKDIIFDAQCALINEVCLEPETFNIYECSEFDRLKLLLALYQANMFKNTIKFTCPNCGTENQFKLDFGNVLAKLNETKLEPRNFVYENNQWKYDFMVEYPSVKRVQAFYKSSTRKNNMQRKQSSKANDSIQNIEYTNIFIKSLELTNKITNNTRQINFNDFDAGDIEQIMSVFPQDVLYADDGILKFIVNEYIKKINDTFDTHECYQCGEKYDNDVTSAESFL